MKKDLQELAIGLAVALCFMVMAIGIVHAEESEPYVDYGEVIVQPDQAPSAFDEDLEDC